MLSIHQCCRLSLTIVLPQSSDIYINENLQDYYFQETMVKSYIYDLNDKRTQYFCHDAGWCGNTFFELETKIHLFSVEQRFKVYLLLFSNTWAAFQTVYFSLFPIICVATAITKSGLCMQYTVHNTGIFYFRKYCTLNFDPCATITPVQVLC